MKVILSKSEFSNWIDAVKQNILQAQIKASLSVNRELIHLYWYLGKEIYVKQKESYWGENFLESVSRELKRSFPAMSGFSTDNIRFMKRMYLFYNQETIADDLNTVVPEKSAQVVQQTNDVIIAQAVQHLQEDELLALLSSIPWGHHTTILRKIKDVDKALFYVNQTFANNWSRSVLEYQIETDLYGRQGNAITNFKKTMPAIHSDLANAILKDPYNFEFIALSEKANEAELEAQLVGNISQFLLELGKGFAYMGKQFKLKVGKKEYRTDLLFYHTRLKCYIVIELKINEFEPEYIGKLNFYISAINEFVKDESDNPTIGILLCKNKDNYEVEFSLKDINKPIGVSEYTYRELPETIRKELPTMEELTDTIRTIIKQ